MKWKTNQRKKIYSSPYLTVYEDNVTLPNGVVIPDFSLVQLRSVVMCVAITIENEVLMCEQYRHGVEQVLLELPAGTYTSEETPEDAMKRELLEETGYEAKELTKLGILYDYPSKDMHSITVYLAQNVRHVAPTHLDPTEEIHLQKIHISKIEEYISQGKIVVAGSLSSLTLAMQYLKRQNV